MQLAIWIVMLLGLGLIALGIVENSTTAIASGTAVVGGGFALMAIRRKPWDGKNR